MNNYLNYKYYRKSNREICGLELAREICGLELGKEIELEIVSGLDIKGLNINNGENLIIEDVYNYKIKAASALWPTIKIKTKLDKGKIKIINNSSKQLNIEIGEGVEIDPDYYLNDKPLKVKFSISGEILYYHKGRFWSEEEWVIKEIIE